MIHAAGMVRTRAFRQKALGLLLTLTLVYAPLALNAATTITNPFPNLSGAASIQSNQAGGEAILTGNLLSVGASLLSASAWRATFAINAQDAGFGLNVADWNHALVLHKSEADMIARTNPVYFPLSLGQLFNLDGSPVQIAATEPASSQFVAGADYGTSFDGLPHFIFTTLITGVTLDTLRQQLVLGQDIFVSHANLASDITDGLNLSVIYESTGSAKAFNSTGAGQYASLTGYAAALDITPFNSAPEPRRVVLLFMGAVLAVARRRRGQ